MSFELERYLGKPKTEGMEYNSVRLVTNMEFARCEEEDASEQEEDEPEAGRHWKKSTACVTIYECEGVWLSHNVHREPSKCWQ